MDLVLRKFVTSGVFFYISLITFFTIKIFSLFLAYNFLPLLQRRWDDGITTATTTMTTMQCNNDNGQHGIFLSFITLIYLFTN